MSGVNGIDTIRSTSGTGFGYTILQFKMSTDMNSAVIDVQKALDGIADTLPKDASRPVMTKFDVNTQPILIVSLSGPASPEELYNQADSILRSLESIPGVGNAASRAGRRKAAGRGGQGGNGLLRHQRHHPAGRSSRPTISTSPPERSSRRRAI